MYAINKLSGPNQAKHRQKSQSHQLYARSMYIYIIFCPDDTKEGIEIGKIFTDRVVMTREKLFFSLDSIITSCMDFKQFRFTKTRRSNLDTMIDSPYMDG